jgi:nucleoside-diphosphate-sugar epimerase
MIREPLAGQRARVPVEADACVALSSPARSIQGLIRVAEATDDEWGPLTAMNLPALSTTVGEMAETLRRKGGEEAYRRLDWEPDPAVERIVGGWPSRVLATRANRLGLVADASFDAIVEQYLQS